MLKNAVHRDQGRIRQTELPQLQYTLEHEAEADKKLYEELITKIREAGINAGFQSSTVRIADNARPASTGLSQRFAERGAWRCSCP